MDGEVFRDGFRISQKLTSPDSFNQSGIRNFLVLCNKRKPEPNGHTYNQTVRGIAEWQIPRLIHVLPFQRGDRVARTFVQDGSFRDRDSYSSALMTTATGFPCRKIRTA